MSLLDELKEKRQDAIENFETQGADIEVTREQLADQQRVRAFWAAQIVDLDKAISALTPEGKEALLESQPEPVHTEVRKQDEQDAAGDWTNGGEDRLDAVCAELLAAPPPAQEAPAIPEGFIPWGGGEYLPVARGTPLVVLYRNGSEVDCTAGDEMSEFWHRSSTLVDHSPDHDIIAYRVIETGETQSELDSSQIEGGDRVEPLHDRPKLTNEEFESLEKIDGVLDAEPSPILRSEVPPAAETYLAPSGDEFATVNGQTHLIVSDEAEAQGQAETQSAEAYSEHHEGEYTSDEIDAIVDALTPNQRSELNGFVYHGEDRLDVIAQLDVKLGGYSMSGSSDLCKVVRKRMNDRFSGCASNNPLDAEPATNPIADDFAKGLLLETETKAEPRKFGGIFSFGAKKTLVGEGV